MKEIFFGFILAFILGAFPAFAQTNQSAFKIPGGKDGVGFDDINFAQRLGKVLVPGGGTGELILIDPETKEMTSIGTLNSAKAYRGGHGEGITSADEGDGFLFTIDRTAITVNVIDPIKKMIVSSAPLSSSPDYVRYVETREEVWVTEPDSERIEVFSFSKSEPVLKQLEFIAVPGGPESLVIDKAHQRAYTHLWEGITVAIDLKTHSIIEKWANGCSGSRGIALDESRGLLFIGCVEGKAVVLDVNSGKSLGVLETGSGIDVIGYNPKLSHLYLAGAKSATLSIVGISKEGMPKLLGVKDTVKGSHCVTGDNSDGIWICDPDHGRILFFKDEF